MREGRSNAGAECEDTTLVVLPRRAKLLWPVTVVAALEGWRIDSDVRGRDADIESIAALEGWRIDSDVRGRDADIESIAALEGWRIDSDVRGRDAEIGSSCTPTSVFPRPGGSAAGAGAEEAHR